MLDFYEKVYFAELDRKSKIQAALAFPIGISVVGITAVKYAIENIDKNAEFNIILLLPLVPAIISFIFFILQCGLFLNKGPYKYIWTMDQFRRHLDDLSAFSKAHPGAPPAEEIFQDHLVNDLARCATHNALINDRRSEALYRANLAVFVLVLFSLLSAAMVMTARHL